MARKEKAGNRRRLGPLRKCPTGIRGLDEITEGGLPRGRPTLICGGPGCGKTLMGMEFLVRGVQDFGEPGVFMAFEENPDELAKNVASLGWDVNGLIAEGKLDIDYVHIERSEIQETGEYDLEGLFVRLSSMIDGIGAKRVVLDTLESLFAGLPNEAILRAELRRLFRWLKNKGVTALITAERGETRFTRHGLEEYVSDCVIVLDHRVINQIATRRLRVVKYRGSKHGTNEYPTLIDEKGLSVLPISALGLTYDVSTEQVSTGVARLDTMFDGGGYYKGSSILVSGTAGSGKSSLAAAFADRTCRDGGRCLYFSFEESDRQIVRNMASIGIHLDRWIRKGLLKFHNVRPTLYGLESHLLAVHNLVGDFQPASVVMDPITNLAAVGDTGEIKSMLTRVIDYLKNQHITALFTSLTEGGEALDRSEVGISSLMDTWLLLRMVESAQERNRILYVLKSRGMGHSNQMREFVLSNKGIELVDVYTGPGAVYTGSARVTQEAADRAASREREQAVTRRRRELAQEQAALEAQVRALQARLNNLAQEISAGENQESLFQQVTREDRADLARVRQADQ